MNGKIIRRLFAVVTALTMFAMTACSSSNGHTQPGSTRSSEHGGTSDTNSSDTADAPETAEAPTKKVVLTTEKSYSDDRALYEAFLKTKSWRDSVAMRVETASEYTYNYDDFNCGKFYYDLDGDGRLELFICLSYQRENLQYSFPYILDIKGDTVFSAYEFQPTCPTRFSNHITLLQGTDKNYYFVIDSNDGGIYTAAGKYLYLDKKLVHVDSVHAYNTTGSLDSSSPGMYYVSDGADLYLNNVIKDWKAGAVNGVKCVDERTFDSRKDALYKGTQIVYYFS